MKKILTILAALAICIALNLGLTNEAQAAEINSSIETGVELQEVRDRYSDHHRRHPHPPPWHRHHPPPPPPDDWDYRRGGPPPPPPPPPPHRRPHRW